MATPPPPVFIPQPNLANRPVGYRDAFSNVIPQSYADLAYQADLNMGSTVIYEGWARPGASTSAAVWKIAKHSYDGSGHLLTTTWPENSFSVASNDYQFAWSNRASYTYA